MNNKFLNNDFKNVHTFTDGEDKVFSFRFGSTVYEEVLSEGRYMSAGWNTAGYTLNVLDGINTRFDNSEFTSPSAFSIVLNNAASLENWEYIDFETMEEKLENGADVLHCFLTLTDKMTSAEVQVHTVLDGTSVMTRYITFANKSQNVIDINGISPMCGGVELIRNPHEYVADSNVDSLYSLGYFESALWGQEGLFKWNKLPIGESGFCGRYKADAFRHPMFMLKNNALGTLMFCQLAWTGGYDINFKLDKDNEVSKLEFNVAVDAAKPIALLNPGEVYVSPEVHITMINGSLDDAVNMMHAHTRKSVFTLPEGHMARCGLVEAGMGPERIMNFEAAKHFIDTAAMVGAETFIIDAGWYLPAGEEIDGWKEGCGNWYPDKEKYGNDFAKFRDYAHSKGLLFGLWMEAESIGQNAQIRKEHPEWMAKNYYDNETRLIDMTNPEAAKWVEGEIGRVIEDYKLDLFRLDFNMEQNVILEKDGKKYSGEYEYYKATCEMYRRLRLKYPKVVFENCASGGRRTSLDFVKNFTHTWVTDWQVAPRSVAITNGMTMVLPPEKVDGLVGGMNSHTRASLDFQARRCIFGRPTTNTYNCVGSEFNPAQIDFIKHTFDIYKEFVRPYAPTGKIYHHTPECFGTEPKGIMILERSSEDSSCGIIGVFGLCDVQEPATMVYPRGIDVSKSYEVTFDNSGAKVTLSGYDMCQNGIRVALDGSLTSELIIYKAM